MKSTSDYLVICCLSQRQRKIKLFAEVAQAEIPSVDIWLVLQQPPMEVRLGNGEVSQRRREDE